MHLTQCHHLVRHTILLPEMLLPFPRCRPRKTDGRLWKKGESLILTSSPVKVRLEDEARLREAKKNMISRPRRTPAIEVETSSNESEIVSLDDSDSFWSEEFEDDDVSLQIKVGDFVIAKVHGGKKDTGRKFIAVVKNSLPLGLQVMFYKQNLPSNRISLTDECAFVATADIVTKLPFPLKDLRQKFKDMIYFDVDLQEYSLC
ncbi:hypothetical protein C0J52_15677 [Blattella germanica]|nr:hypothetical protein C0J52_15677 [Blattella germanica]